MATTNPRSYKQATQGSFATQASERSSDLHRMNAMTAQTNPKPTLGELFDLPDHVRSDDFVLRLTEAILRPDLTIRDYVVTDQLRRCFDEALSLVKDAITGRRSVGAYLHGSFGTGKSHFMAVLYLLLS